jgi:thiol:disulfide interchange protein DsbC
MNITRLRLTDSFPMLLKAWILALLCSINVAIADNGVDIDRSAIEETISKALPNTKIDSVQLSVVPGLVEIVAGNNLFYFDPTGRYLVVGNIYDMRTATDLTAQRKRDFSQTPKIEWEDLPLESAVKYGGHGPSKLAVFFDPDCPWCKRLHEQLSAMDDVEVYAIMYPVESLHAGAKSKAAAILCHNDPLQALNTIMKGGELPAVIDQDCLARSSAAIDRVEAFARRHDIHGTPTLIAPDGRVRPGFLEAKPLKAWLTRISHQAATERRD